MGLILKLKAVSLNVNEPADTRGNFVLAAS